MLLSEKMVQMDYWCKSYCEENRSVFAVFWSSGEVMSSCFTDTVVSIILLGIIILSTLEHVVWLVGRSAVSNPSDADDDDVLLIRGGGGRDEEVRLTTVQPKRPLCALLHLLLHVVVAVLAPLRTFAPSLLSAIIGEEEEEGETRRMFGHTIVRLVVQATTWVWIFILFLCLERKKRIRAATHSVHLWLFWIVNFVERNFVFISTKDYLGWRQFRSPLAKFQLVLFILDYVCVLTVLVLGFRAPLLKTLSVRPAADEHVDSDDSAAQGSTFRNVLSKIRLLLPFLWPKSSLLLQVRVLICFIILAAGRVANLFTPILYKAIVNSLTYAPAGLSHLVFRWDYVVYFSILRFLQGSVSSGGLLNTLRSFLWIPVQQYTTRTIQVRLYDHLHSLSLDWHLGRKTGEVLRIMDRGTLSVQNLLSYTIFNILPTVADIVVAVVYFVSYFNVWFGLIVFVTMALYLAATIAITEWRTKFRREMNLLDNEQRSKGVDALLNFETVKYYNAEKYEVKRYEDSVLKYQRAEWLSSASLSALNLVQNVIIGTGLLIGTLLCAYMVATGLSNFNVGDYVLFTTYVLQLYAPLNFIGTIYRMIQTSFVDMENMFDLLNEAQEVRDAENAVNFELKAGRIEFRNVSFNYKPEQPILQDVSFVVEPGTVVALVGPSGAGKSTVLRLLFRFYDVLGGAVLVDGQNVTQVTQKSLRQHIGVVPQDTVLFNDTIRRNIAYGRPDSADEQLVELAARAADIHDRIRSFPQGYDTVVGERGLKLSGGEKQRVAIARTIVKSPAIVVLDEATSALDTRTERTIQASLRRMCAGRTSLVVAHRLSTVTSADMILVLGTNGKILERGSHGELLDMDGEYAKMWKSQHKTNYDTQADLPANNDTMLQSGE